MIALSVLKKDFFTFITYKLNFLMTVISIFIYCFAIYQFSSFASSGFILDQNTENLFLYFLTVLFVIDLTITTTAKPPLVLSFYQTSGLIEEISHDFKIFLKSYSSLMLFPFIFSIIKILIYLIFGIIFFDLEIFVNFEDLNLIIYLFIYMLYLHGVCLLAASFTIIVKRGNPVIQLNNVATIILGGALFPTDSLNNTLSVTGNLLPGKFLIDKSRSAFLENEQISFLFDLQFLKYSLTSLFVLIVGLIAFRYSFNYAKQLGIFSNY